MSAVDKFSLFWWGLCAVVVTVYASFDGWTSYHAVGALLYAGLFVFEFDRQRRARKKRDERSVAGRAIRDGHLSPMFGNAISDWERVFTWRAVHTLDNGWVIWRFVWRRRIAKHSHLGGPVDFWFQYLVKLQYVYD
ncbi:hypothetical protein SEA_MAKAI_87 [Arthrobacter phage Makai]|nr:hypothetical protein SEA_MAKAI_87 [Arthrobacter phage Makai]